MRTMPQDQNLASAESADGVLVAPLGTADYLGLVSAESLALLHTVGQRAMDDRIPFCDGWALRDLVVHLGYIYRWVAVIVGEQRAQPPSREECDALQDPDPTDNVGAVDRLAAARGCVLGALRKAPDDLACWTTWAVPSAREFWARRMLHETLIHRVDVHNAGQRQTHSGDDLAIAMATDGVDEMICGFAQRYSKRLRTENPATLTVVSTDTGLRWWAQLGPTTPQFGRGDAPSESDTQVFGRAGELLLLLWNRRTADGLEVRGDAGVLETWAREAHL
jgi:uncharacterized protein (TIGR03083 family)